MNESPETILQLGAGRFLRAFVDRFVQNANDAGQAVGRVVIAQSTTGTRADLLNGQPDGYHVLVRGYDDGQLVDRVETVRSVTRALIAQTQWSQVLELARSPDLRFIVSNATEAGYSMTPEDRVDSSPPSSLPGKLTQMLWERFKARGRPLVLLPCELIERNASKLLELVSNQASQWNLSGEFDAWLKHDCCWLNNLVDCMVTRAPEDHPLAAEDPLLVHAEPYALWAIERPRSGNAQLFQHPAIQLVEDLMPFYLRKVRILNGLHTAMAAKFLPAGFVTVRQVLEDPAGLRWVRGLLFEEIVPTIAYRVDDVAEFADQTFDRLRNPFLAHRLSDIAMHHTDKVRVRLQPTCEEYQQLFGKMPRRLADAMAQGVAT